MRILLLYTPRCGSTSILKYFSKVKPDFQCFMDPWFPWAEENKHVEKIEYGDIIKKDNIFVKATYKTLPAPIEVMVKDFDKTIFLLRRDIEEQVESSIVAHREQNFYDTNRRVYKLSSLSDDEYNSMKDKYIFLNNEFINASLKNNIPLFYYEDLYYGDFTPLFKELGVDFNLEYFEEYLDISKRYREGIIKDKSIKTLI